jgi:hypothetical protein
MGVGELLYSCEFVVTILFFCKVNFPLASILESYSINN